MQKDTQAELYEQKFQIRNHFYDFFILIWNFSHIFYELSISTDYPVALAIFFLLNGISVSLLAKAIFVSSNIPSSKKFSPSLQADFTTTLHSHRHCDCSVLDGFSCCFGLGLVHLPHLTVVSSEMKTASSLALRTVREDWRFLNELNKL